MSYIQSIDTDDLTNPSSTRKYDLGVKYVDVTTAAAIKPEYMYIKSHTALTQYQPYQLSISHTAGSEITGRAPATQTSGAQIFAPQVAVTSGYYCWVQVKGLATVLTTDTFAAGDYAEVLNAGSGLTLDGGASGSTVEGKHTVGVATTATSAGSATVLLNGNVVEISAA